MADELEFRALDAAEQDAFQAGIDFIRRIAQNMGTQISDGGDPSDIDFLEDLLNELRWPEDDTSAIGIGLVFGTIVARATGMVWVRIADQWGEETSLKLPGFQYFAHPVSMITKRLERGEEIDLGHLLTELTRMCREDGPKQREDPS